MEKIKAYLTLLRFKNHHNYLIVILSSLYVNSTAEVIPVLAYQYIMFNIFLYGGIYIVNAIIECKNDQLHSKKCNRPLPLGLVSKREAYVLIIVLWTLSFLFSEHAYHLIYIIFILTNLIYSLYIKKHFFRNLIGITAGLRVGLGFIIAGKNLFYAPSLIILASLFMMSVQQTKFFVEKTKGHENTLLKNIVFTVLMIPLLYWNFLSFPLIDICVLLSVPIFIYLPLFYPNSAKYLLGADVVSENGIKDTKKSYIILFDFDGTICDSITAIKDAVNSFSSVYNFKFITDECFKSLKGMSIKQIQKELGIGKLKLISLGRHTRRILGQNIHELQPIPGIASVLHTLKQNGFLLMILSSNNMENIERFLELNNINIFDQIYTYEGIGSGLWSKKKKLKQVLKQHKEIMNGIVYVCDELRDIHSAHALNIPVIAVGWGANHANTLETMNPNVVIHLPSQLMDSILLLSNHHNHNIYVEKNHKRNTAQNKGK